MVKGENNDTAGLMIPEADEVITQFFDKTGNLGEETNAVAKVTKIHNKESDRIVVNYYIKHGRGMLFDPYGMDANKINAYNFQFKKVDHKVYSQYVQYLKTRRSIFLTYAQREFKDKGY